jgi:hypothetical protein
LAKSQSWRRYWLGWVSRIAHGAESHEDVEHSRGGGSQLFLMQVNMAELAALLRTAVTQDIQVSQKKNRTLFRLVSPFACVIAIALAGVTDSDSRPTPEQRLFNSQAEPRGASRYPKLRHFAPSLLPHNSIFFFTLLRFRRFASRRNPRNLCPRPSKHSVSH